MKRQLDIQKGQTVFIKVEAMSNLARSIGKLTLENVSEWLFEGTVTSVGRKYITVNENGHESKFSIEDDYREHYTAGGANYKLYTSRQEALDVVEADKLYLEIRDYFSFYNRGQSNIPLDKLRRINDILKEN